MKYLVAIGCLLGLLFETAAAQSSPAVPDRQVISSEDIRQAGLLRPADLFQLIDGWTYVVRDGWHTDAAAGTLTVSGSGAWEVWIDGHRSTTRIFGAQDLNLLPIAMEDIAYVESFRSPRFQHGVFATDGLLHIHTQSKDREGVALHGSTWIGNEAGDPGPLRFLGDESPNVDHLGPDYSGSVGWFSRDIALRASGVSRKAYPTDAAIRERHLAVASGYPTIELRGASANVEIVRVRPANAEIDRVPPANVEIVRVRPADVGVDQDGSANIQVGRGEANAVLGEGQLTNVDAVGRGRHDLAVQWSRQQDFYFLEPLGSEIPVRTKRIFAGAHGEREVRQGIDLRYRASFTSTALGHRPNQRNAAFDWGLNRFEGGLELNVQRPIFEATTGFFAERDHAVSGADLARSTLDRAGLYIRLAGSGRDGLRPAVTLQTRVVDGNVQLQALASLRGQLATQHAYAASLALIRRHASDRHPFWFWTQQGYPLLDRLGVDHTVPAVLAESRAITFDARWRTAWGPRWSGTLGVFARHFSNEAIVQQRVGSASDGLTVSGPVRLTGPHGGQVAGVEGTLEGRLHDRIRQRLYVRMEPYRSGSDPLTAALSTRPRAEVRSRWFVAVAPTFNLSLRLAARTATRWPDYSGSALGKNGGAGPVGSSEMAAQTAPAAGGIVVPWAWTVDFTAAKSFWEGRTRLDLDVRNALNRRYRHHPIGATYDLRLSIRLVVRLE